MKKTLIAFALCISSFGQEAKPKPLFDQGGGEIKAPTPSSWFVQGDASGNLLMIDMSQVTAVNKLATPWRDPNTGADIAGRVWLRGGYVDLGVDLMNLFSKVFGQWVATPQ